MANRLRRTFDTVERAVGKPLEDAINTPGGGDILLALAKVPRAGFRTLRAARSLVVHMAALPTNRDVDVLNAKISRLQLTVEELSEQIEESKHTP